MINDKNNKKTNLLRIKTSVASGNEFSAEVLEAGEATTAIGAEVEIKGC
jgi:hypothetical protein